MSGFNPGAIDPALLSSGGNSGGSSSSTPSTNTTLQQQQSIISPINSSEQSHQSVQQSASPSTINQPVAISDQTNPVNQQSNSLDQQQHQPQNQSTSQASHPLPLPIQSTSSVSINGSNPKTQPETPATPQPTTNDPFMANGMPLKEHEMHQKDQELAQFLLKMDDYKPVIPDEVAEYYLERVGFSSNDLRLKRLLVLACQKFISDIAEDSFSYASTRTGQAPGSRQGQLVSNLNSAGSNSSTRRDRTRTVLTQEDLTQALAEYGINANRAPYYL
ncbi:transcription initiation factor TFIID 23-30kDa subunit-domain-containing protein [Phakopsora pachyrhizi]|uniref:Transcription initiation factor TFIID 23-30kDa subunit-domain-containing protein n=1 Tax=Phakopsora pachyrhizi TaxID=170000 RepID=A0AAV0B3U3_PHAPC|nr:transcription initiation factor TFIID 23-30kDa subunit-domain-containing protein [Phakopsora pachyrhizi]CAH7681056.1 transcription initiation factor TFIID 23-30kDa subunit-domain-containing protein [Phakopsora pachyrhizi]